MAGRASHLRGRRLEGRLARRAESARETTRRRAHETQRRQRVGHPHGAGESHGRLHGNPRRGPRIRSCGHPPAARRSRRAPRRGDLRLAVPASKPEHLQTLPARQQGHVARAERPVFLAHHRQLYLLQTAPDRPLPVAPPGKQRIRTRGGNLCQVPESGRGDQGNPDHVRAVHGEGRQENTAPRRLEGRADDVALRYARAA